MKKKLAYFIVLALIISFVPNVYSINSDIQILEADLKEIAPPSLSLDDDYVLPSECPNGSEIEWTWMAASGADIKDLFDKNGKYVPKIGEGAFEVLLTANLSYGEKRLSETFTVYSFRTQKYRLNGFIYEKADKSGTTRHPQAGSRIIAADIEKNPRAAEAIFIAAVYEEGQLLSMSTAKVCEDGEIPLNVSLGSSLEGKEMRSYIWDGFDNCKPIYEPQISEPEKEKDKNFLANCVAETDDGDDASFTIDGDYTTKYCFAKSPEKNTRGMSLLLEQPNHEQERVQSASYSFDRPIEGKAVISMDFLVPETNSSKGILYLYDSDNNMVFTLLILGSSLMDNNQKSVYENIEPYRWYTLRVEADMLTKTADVYIDGSVMAVDMSFRGNYSEIARMQIHNSPGSAASTYIDNITVTDDGTEILNENFEEYKQGDVVKDWSVSVAGGSVAVCEFTDEELSVFPQQILINFGRLCNISSVSVTIPDGINIKYRLEIATLSNSFVRVASHMDSFVSQTVTDSLGRVKAAYLRLWIYQAKNSAGEYCNAEISEIKVEAADEETSVNVAPLAHVSASSESVSANYDARGLTDGMAAMYSKNGEWISYRESNPSIVLSWDEPQTIDSIELFGRMTAGEQTGGAIIYFDDGNCIEARGIPKDGTPKIVTFDEKKINWLKIKLTEPGKGNIGLSEVKVLASGKKDEISYITPWKTVPLTEGYSGQWVVSDDLNGDDSVDFVSARVAYEYENHSVSAACAVDLNGNTLWTWGTKNGGQTNIGSDVPCQIYDLDNDGTKEVLLCNKTQLIILNGATGEQKAAYTLPKCEKHPGEWASDCIIIADLSGTGYPSDIIVKTRYTDAWAYTKDWQPIWHACYPNGMKTAHAPEIINIDEDENDEVFVGFGFIDNDGKELAMLDDSKFDINLSVGHIDSFAVLNFSEKMERTDMRFAVSPCGARNFFVIDGNGNKIWESTSGLHYESLICGRYTENTDGIQILTNPVLDSHDDVGGGYYAPLYIYNYDDKTGECSEAVQLWGFEANRYPHAVNFGGEYDYIYNPVENSLIDGNGRTKVQLVSYYRDNIASMCWSEHDGYHNDMDGDGTQDIVGISSRGGVWHVSIYQNLKGPKTASKLGTGHNYTFY